MRVVGHIGCCLVAMATCHSIAFACSPRPPAKTAEEVRQRARDSFSAADAVVDAKVVMAANTDPTIDGVMPLTVLETLRVWKGETAEIVPVISLSTCDTLLGRKGARHRVLLTRVNDHLFTVSGPLNDQPAADGTTFNQEIDRLIGNQRPKDFVGVYGSAPVATASLPDSQKIESPWLINKWTTMLLGIVVAALSSIATWFLVRRKSPATGS